MWNRGSGYPRGRGAVCELWDVAHQIRRILSIFLRSDIVTVSAAEVKLVPAWTPSVRRVDLDNFNSGQFSDARWPIVLFEIMRSRGLAIFAP